jgi:radical SAM protein (TIGR04043 family)
LNTTRLKIELLCRGARTEERLDRGRKGGAGPTGGRYFILPNETCIEIPLQGKFIENSPFILVETDGNWRIVKSGEALVDLKLVPRPKFYDKTTSDGIPMNKIAVLHGKDCLASTVYSKCIYWTSAKQCKFCGIELGRNDRLMLKQPKQLGEVAEEAFKEGTVKHVTLTTGTPPGPSKGASILAEAAEAIKEHVNMPIHVQLEPPENSRYLENLYQAGVDTVGLHIESFDNKVASYVCPMKLNYDGYLQAWKSAFELFGEGQVSTFIIAGMGETDESILSGSEKAAEIGVIPYLLPLRPIPGTVFEEVSPPTPRRMMKLYQSVAETLHRVGLDPGNSKAGCVRCGACSALLEAFHLPHHIQSGDMT